MKPNFKDILQYMSETPIYFNSYIACSRECTNSDWCKIGYNLSPGNTTACLVGGDLVLRYLSNSRWHVLDIIHCSKKTKKSSAMKPLLSIGTARHMQNRFRQYDLLKINMIISYLCHAELHISCLLAMIQPAGNIQNTHPVAPNILFDMMLYHAHLELKKVRSLTTCVST